MFKEDTRTGLTVKLSAQEKTQSQGTSKASPTKRKALGKRTGGKPTRKLQTPRGMSLQTEMEQTINRFTSRKIETRYAKPKISNSGNGIF